jgi:hypothetical protein
VAYNRNPRGTIRVDEQQVRGPIDEAVRNGVEEMPLRVMHGGTRYFSLQMTISAHRTA